VGASILLLGASLASLRWEPSRLGLPEGTRRRASNIGALLLLVPAISILGMLPALCVFCFVMLHVVERLPLARAAAIALATAIGSWLLFERLLSVPLPKPIGW
jgi:hypothetical protein